MEGDFIHFELLSSEINETDLKMLGVYGAMARGLSKIKAFQKCQIDEDYYDLNIDRVLTF